MSGENLEIIANILGPAASVLNVTGEETKAKAGVVAAVSEEAIAGAETGLALLGLETFHFFKGHRECTNVDKPH